MAEKPPILFLHGAFAGPEIWTRFVAPWFAARGHRVAGAAAVGAAWPGRRRGCATTSPGPRPRPTRWQAPPVVVGHSLGGLVAQHLAARRRVAGAGAGGLARALPASGRRSGSSRRGRRTCWRRSSSPRPAAAALIGIEAVRRALFTETAGRLDRRRSRRVPDRESPLALLDGLTWDLPAWFLARRARDAGAPRRPRRLRAGHRPLGDRARLRRGDRADARLRPRHADRSALEEPRLADQRLARRAADRWAEAAAAPAELDERLSRFALKSVTDPSG